MLRRLVLAALLALTVVPATASAVAPLPDPGYQPTPADLAAWSPVPDYAGAVPVLVYHGIHDITDPAADPYAVSRGNFVRQMAMLATDGFHTISLADYARFAGGDASGLPDRPILITFDDGRADSFRGADAVLARYGMRATMFVITARADGPAPGYLGWDDLRAMAASGRWDLQLHAGAGHVRIATGPGTSGPFYANLRWTNGVRERFSAFQDRVTGDILGARNRMAAQIPGDPLLAFAVPYGDYGQLSTNYRPIPGWEIGWLQSVFGVVLLQDHHVYNLPGQRVAQRYGIHSTTTAAILHDWLASAIPPSAVRPGAAAPAPVARPARPRVAGHVRVGRRSVVVRLRAAASVRLVATRRTGRSRRAVPVRIRGRLLRDRGLRPGTRYRYIIRAVAGDGTRSRALVLAVRTRR